MFQIQLNITNSTLFGELSTTAVLIFASLSYDHIVFVPLKQTKTVEMNMCSRCQAKLSFLQDYAGVKYNEITNI